MGHVANLGQSHAVSDNLKFLTHPVKKGPWVRVPVRKDQATFHIVVKVMRMGEGRFMIEVVESEYDRIPVISGLRLPLEALHVGHLDQTHSDKEHEVLLEIWNVLKQACYEMFFNEYTQVVFSAPQFGIVTFNPNRGKEYR